MWLQQAIVLWLLTIGIGVKRADGFHKYQMKVCIKEGIGKSAKPVIDGKTVNFKNFAVNSDIFVDKSVLIKSILEEQPLVSLTFPSKWGKSINLDMLRTFLETEFDHNGDPIQVNDTWSYMYFKKGLVRNNDGRCEKLMNPPLIAGHKDIISKHLAQYPVIHIDLSMTASKANFAEYFDAFRNSIASVFKKYDFLIEVIRDKLDDASTMSSAEKTEKKSTLRKFKSFHRMDVTDYTEMMKSLQFISALLREHFHQRVVVLIDNYDAPIQLGYIEQASRIASDEAQKFMNFFVDFLSNTFANKENIVRGVLTGVLSLDVISTPLLGLKQIVNYNAVSKNIYPFYGFTAIDVSQLLARSFTPEAVKTILEKYSGYHVSNFPDITFYNPGLIVHVALKEKLDEYRFYGVHTKGPSILSQVLRHQDVRTVFQNLISRNADAEMKRRNFTLHREDILSLNRVIKGEEQTFSRKDVALVLVFHFATGYLTLDLGHLFPNWNKRVHFKIPCLDTEQAILQQMLKYYESAVGNETSANAKLAANSLIHFVNTDIVTSLRGTFLKFYQGLFDHKSFKDLKQNFIDSGHFLLLLYVRSDSNFEYNVGLNTTYYDRTGEKLAPYITMHGKGYGLICGFNYTETSDVESSPQAPEVIEWHRLKLFESFFNDKSVQNIRVLVLRYAYGSRKLNVVRNAEEGVW